MDTRGSLKPFKTYLPTLLILWAIVFLGHNWEPGLKMDGMTNAILAKHILSTGDWSVFHYTSSAYPDYYPHPPLLIWIEALAFKLWGVSDFVARICPALFGLGTVLGVYYWGSLGGSTWTGFIASVVLLTSTRYFKYAADAFLEGPLAFWFVWGGLFFLKSRQLKATEFHKKAIYSACFGICFGMSFLTKSIFAFSLPLALFAALGLDLLQSHSEESLSKGQKHSLQKFPFNKLWTEIPFNFYCFCGAFAVLVPWLIWGHGISFLEHHWIDIRDRVHGTQNGLEHLKPAVNLLSTYWPWLPLFLIASIQCIQKREAPSRTALVMAGTTFFGLTYSGFYFEHYLVPFYPMAALVTAPWIARHLEPGSKRIKKGIDAAVILGATILAVFPIQLHSSHTEPLTQALEEVSIRCQNEKEILITDRLMEKWMALAVVLWKMPVEATSTPLDGAEPSPGRLLLTRADEKPDLLKWNWVPLQTSAAKLYQPKNFSPLCR